MTDQVIAEIEHSIADFSKRTGCECMAIYSGGEWIISAHMKGIRERNHDALVAIRHFEQRLRALDEADAAVARTLGLEAAE